MSLGRVSAGNVKKESRAMHTHHSGHSTQKRQNCFRPEPPEELADRVAANHADDYQQPGILARVFRHCRHRLAKTFGIFYDE